MRQVLEEPTKSGKQTKAEALARRILKLAYKGHSAYAKEVLDRVDGATQSEGRMRVEVVFVDERPDGDDGPSPN